MVTFWRDLRYGGRMLAKAPGHTVAAAIALSLGIGLTTGMFSIVYGALWRDRFDRLETLFGNFPGSCVVVFELRYADGSVAMLQAQQRVRSNPELIEAVRQICGDRAVEMAATA